MILFNPTSSYLWLNNNQGTEVFYKLYKCCVPSKKKKKKKKKKEEEEERKEK